MTAQGRLGGAAVLHLAAAAALAVLPAACFGHASGRSARPPAGSDAEIVFDQLASIRRSRGATPPTWVEPLAPLARDGAARLGGGADGRVVAKEVAHRAAYSLGRDVLVWSLSSDSLYGLGLPNKLVGQHNLLLAVGVALMSRGGAGRYAIVIVTPEAGGGVTP